MNKTKTKTTKAKAVPLADKKTNLRLPVEAVSALHRLKVVYGHSNKFAVTRGLMMLEQSLLRKGVAL